MIIKVLKAIVLLPGEILSGLGYLTGWTERGEERQVITEVDEDDTPIKEYKPIHQEGILGFILNGIKAVFRGFGNLLQDHKTAISIAFWLSLAVAGGLALTLYFWPAALAAIATFTIVSLSIAAVVGSNPLLQIAAIAALAFVATSLVSYISAAIVNLVRDNSEDVAEDEEPLLEPDSVTTLGSHSNTGPSRDNPTKTNDATQSQSRDRTHYSPRLFQCEPPPESTKDEDLTMQVQPGI